jgi:hypothetical protein
LQLNINLKKENTMRKLVKDLVAGYLADLDSYPKEMCEQIMYGHTEQSDSGLVAMMSWGASNLTGLPESEDYRAALQFHVQGLKFQGQVTVQLHWLDYYVIYFGDTKVCDEVYCDQLTQVLDNRIE